MIRRPPRSTLDRSSAASDVYKRQAPGSADSAKLRETDPQRVRETLDARDVAIRARRQRQLYRERVRRGKARIDSFQLAEAPHDEPHAHEQHQCPCNLDCHERVLHGSLIHISEPTRLLSISYA